MDTEENSPVTKNTKAKKVIMIICIVLACIIATGLVYALSVNAYVKSYSKEYILSEADALKLENVDCVLVLGAGLEGDKLSDMLEDRVVTGIEMYNGNGSEKLLMSGDHGRADHNEVGAMKTYAIKKGVKSSDIFMDHAGFSTYDSMYRSKNIFGVKKMIIVTQEYHLYRSIYIARKLGIDAYGVDGQKRQYTAATNIHNEVREMLARNKDFIKMFFKPESTYLGDVIPISGDGDVTNDKTYA